MSGLLWVCTRKIFDTWAKRPKRAVRESIEYWVSTLCMSLWRQTPGAPAIRGNVPNVRMRTVLLPNCSPCATLMGDGPMARSKRGHNNNNKNRQQAETPLISVAIPYLPTGGKAVHHERRVVHASA